MNHEICPKFEPPIAVGKYLKLILSEGKAEVTFKDGEYIVICVESAEMEHKINLLRELEFVHESSFREVLDPNVPENQRLPLEVPVAAGDYLETILGWGVAEVELAEDQYIISRMKSPDMFRKIKMLVELELVKQVHEPAAV